MVTHCARSGLAFLRSLSLSLLTSHHVCLNSRAQMDALRLWLLCSLSARRPRTPAVQRFMNGTSSFSSVLFISHFTFSLVVWFYLCAALFCSVCLLMIRWSCRDCPHHCFILFSIHLSSPLLTSLHSSPLLILT